MDNLTIAIASGLRSRMEAIDLVAHNLANSSTAGFKTERELTRVYFSEDALAGDDGAGPVGLRTANNETRWTDFSQGTIAPTGNPLDFAIAGKGFFVAKSPNGPLYLRNGSFTMSADGKLVTREGYEIETRNDTGQAVRFDPLRPIEASPDGGLSQGGTRVGRLFVGEFAAGAEFEKRAGNYFSFSTAQPIEARGATVRQGHLEQSNVEPAEQSVRLMNVMRQFEMLTRALTLTGEMSRKAVEDVARVG